MRDSEESSVVFQRIWRLVNITIEVISAGILPILITIAPTKTGIPLLDELLSSSPWRSVLLLVCMAPALVIQLRMIRRLKPDILKAVESYASILNRLTKKSAVPKAKQPTVTTTALAALVINKARQRRYAALVLLLSIATYVVSAFMLDIPLSLVVVSVLALGAVLLQAGEFALEYRIRHALYGTNEYEARQIIQFVLSNAENNDLSGGMGISEVKVDPAMESLLQSNWGVAAS